MRTKVITNSQSSEYYHTSAVKSDIENDINSFLSSLDPDDIVSVTQVSSEYTIYNYNI